MSVGNRVNKFFRRAGKTLRSRLSRLSFRTGAFVLAMCVPFYIISFAQMALPMSVSVKGILWVIFFGLAKAFQYGGLTIIGAEGIRRIKDYWYRRRVS